MRILEGILCANKEPDGEKCGGGVKLIEESYSLLCMKCGYTEQAANEAAWKSVLRRSRPYEVVDGALTKIVVPKTFIRQEESFTVDKSQEIGYMHLLGRAKVRYNRIVTLSVEGIMPDLTALEALNTLRGDTARLAAETFQQPTDVLPELERVRQLREEIDPDVVGKRLLDMVRQLLEAERAHMCTPPGADFPKPVQIKQLDQLRQLMEGQKRLKEGTG